MRIVIALLITVVMALPAASRPLTADEQHNLESALTSFTQAIQRKRMRQVIAVVPPKVLATIAKSVRTTPQKMRREMVRELQTGMKDVRFTDMEVITGNLDARDANAPDGGAIIYAFVPMNFKMHIKLHDFAVTSSILALREDGQWYFMRVEDEGQKTILADVYPFLKNARYPVGKMEQY